MGVGDFGDLARGAALFVVADHLLGQRQEQIHLGGVVLRGVGGVGAVAGPHVGAIHPAGLVDDGGDQAIGVAGLDIGRHLHIAQVEHLAVVDGHGGGTGGLEVGPGGRGDGGFFDGGRIQRDTGRGEVVDLLGMVRVVVAHDDVVGLGGDGVDEGLQVGLLVAVFTRVKHQAACGAFDVENECLEVFGRVVDLPHSGRRGGAHVCNTGRECTHVGAHDVPDEGLHRAGLQAVLLGHRLEPVQARIGGGRQRVDELQHAMLGEVVFDACSRGRVCGLRSIKGEGVVDLGARRGRGDTHITARRGGARFAHHLRRRHQLGGDAVEDGLGVTRRDDILRCKQGGAAAAHVAGRHHGIDTAAAVGADGACIREAGQGIGGRQRDLERLHVDVGGVLAGHRLLGVEVALRVADDGFFQRGLDLLGVGGHTQPHVHEGLLGGFVRVVVFGRMHPVEIVGHRGHEGRARQRLGLGAGRRLVVTAAAGRQGDRGDGGRQQRRHTQHLAKEPARHFFCPHTGGFACGGLGCGNAAPHCLFCHVVSFDGGGVEGEGASCRRANGRWSP